MLTGLCLLLATGVCWTALAAIVAGASAHHVSMERVQPFSALLVLLVMGWVGLQQGAVAASGWRLVLQLGCLVAAGAANYAMLILVQCGMNRGNGGVVWAFTQSSMTMPFLMGIVVFGEAAAPLRITGLIVVLSALIFFAADRPKGSSGGDWLLPTLGAFLLSGLAQSCASLPSYLQISGMTALRRMLLTQAGIVLAFLVHQVSQARRPDLKGKAVWGFAALFGLSNLIALLCFYNGLNRLADAGCAAIGYPAAQGMSIAFFFLYNRLANGVKARALSWVAFAILLSGILLLIAGSLWR